MKRSDLLQEQSRICQINALYADIQAVPCAVFVVDTNEPIIFWNKPAEKLTGYTASEMVGSACSTQRMNLCSADNAAKSTDFCPLKSPGKIGAVECEINCKDKSTLPVFGVERLQRIS